MIYSQFYNEYNMSIWKFIYHVIRESRVLPAIASTSIAILGLSYMIFKQSILMQEDLSVYSTVVSLGWYAMFDRFFKASNELIVIYFIMLPSKLIAERLIVESLVSRSPSSLLLMKENAYALKNAGVRALLALIENSLSVITPIVLLISRGAALSTRLSSTHLIIVLLSITSMFFAGSAILTYDHHKKSILSKKETELDEQARSLITSIATHVINGGSTILPSWLVNLKKEESIPSTKHNIVMGIMYGLLEIATTGIPVALVWHIKGSDDFLSLYIIIQPMFWNTWYLFWSVKSLVVSTAPWSQYAEFMKTTQLYPTNLPEPISCDKMMVIFEKPDIDEIELIGPSGCGKTTLMRNIIADISNKFMIGYILYIDQFACLPSGLSIYDYYESSFTKEEIPEHFEDALLHYAEELGISNVINKNTLKISFSNPSGGEKKRVIFLKYVLPILIGASKVMIAFLDEVSAGLDTDSFAKVRVIIEEIKKKGVKVVSIDHHEHNGNNILKTQVFKKVYEIPHTPLKKDLFFLQKIIVKLFPYVYHKEKNENDIECGISSTGINVWAPVLGINEP
jgi:ABC-type Mn2+/Zn2+ transport system ATPase subunit